MKIFIGNIKFFKYNYKGLLMASKNNLEILLCLVGKSPQIVTEALYCLKIQKRINLDKIIILTTHECKNIAEKTLSEQLNEFYKHYKLKPIDIEIISGDEDFYGNKSKRSINTLIYETIRQLKLSNCIIHSFISGGRKTMSADLAIAMTIYGTDNDKMYHVIASPEFCEMGLYFPRNSKEAKHLILVEKPYVKLKYRASEKEEDIHKIIENVQSTVDSAINLPKMTIHTASRRIVIDDKEISLPPMIFAIYLFFARQKKFIPGGKSFSDQHIEELWNIYCKVAPSEGHKLRVQGGGYDKSRKIDFTQVQKAIPTIRNIFSKFFGKDSISEFYVISTEGSYADKRYGIRLPKSKIKIVK